MPSYRECLSMVRQMLGEPHPAAPTEMQLFRYLSNNAQLMFNQVLNTPVSWTLQFWDLTINPNQNIYPVVAQNFGKDVLVETIDQDDPSHVSRPVRRMSFQSAEYGGGDVYTSNYPFPLAGTVHTVQTMAFYRENGVPNLRIFPENPPDGVTQQYRIWYETAEVNTDSLGNDFGIPAGIPLLCIRTAFSALPLARWCGYDEKQNADKRKEFGVVLTSDKADQQKAWEKYTATDRQAGLTVMRGFHDEEYRYDY